MEQLRILHYAKAHAVRYRSDRNNPTSCGVCVNEGELLRELRLSKA